MGSTMNGRKLYVNPPMTAYGVCSTWNRSLISPKWRSGESNIPLSESMKFHESVRITNETKNGSNNRKSRLDLYGPPRNAIQYATGYPITRQRSVAMRPYTSDRTNCTWY